MTHYFLKIVFFLKIRCFYYKQKIFFFLDIEGKNVALL